MGALPHVYPLTLLLTAPPPPPIRLINSEKSQLHSSPHREVGHMVEWRAELQNYHIKPGFPGTLRGESVVAADSEKKGKYYEDQGAQVLSDNHC